MIYKEKRAESFNLFGQKTRSKYNNVLVRSNSTGEMFHSKLEFKRNKELNLLEKAKKISNLRRQVKIPIVINGLEVTYCLIDHVYEENGVTVFEETKGYLDSVQKLRYKILKAMGVNLVFYPNKKEFDLCFGEKEEEFELLIDDDEGRKNEAFFLF